MNLFKQGSKFTNFLKLITYFVPKGFTVSAFMHAYRHTVMYQKFSKFQLIFINNVNCVQNFHGRLSHFAPKN